MKSLLLGVFLVIFGTVAFASAEICPAYNETTHIEIKLVRGGMHFGPVADDQNGIERARLNSDPDYNRWSLLVSNSYGQFIGATAINEEKYDYLRLVFSQLSKKCPLTLILDRKTLNVVSMSPACDPYK